MLYYLLSTCFSSLSNILGKYFKKAGDFGNCNLMDIYFHVDFINLIVFFIIFFICKLRGSVKFSLRDTFCRRDEFIQVLIFAIPIFAAAYKTYMMEYMKISDIEISAMIKPFCVWGLAIMFLGERFYPFYVKYALLAIVGFLIANSDLLPFISDPATGKISFSTASYANTNIWFLLSYLAIASVGDVTRRYYCRKCAEPMQAICVEFVMFALYGIIFVTLRGTFSWEILFSPYTFLISLITILHHFCIIHGVQKAPTVTALEFVNFSKIVFTIIFSYFILNTRVVPHKIYGAIIIAVTLVLFNIQLRKNKKDSEQNKNTEK